MSVQPLKGGGKLCIQDLIKNVDIDGDGDVDDEDLKIKQILMKMDQDGDGHISLSELVNIGKAKMEDEKKMGHLKKILYISVAVACVFIILSLSVTIAAIELTKESRNSDSTMIDASSGKPVSTAVLTGTTDPLTGKKDNGIKDSDGNLASVGLATVSVHLDSKTLTLESAKIINSLTLPVLDRGASMTMSVTVTGFEMGASGIVFYTASGGMVVVKGEDIVVYKKDINGVIRTLPVDATRPGTRRSRSLLQSNGGSDTACGSGMACGSGTCQDASCQTPPLPDTTQAACSGNNAVVSYFSSESSSNEAACAPCPEGSVVTSDHLSCICANNDEVFSEAQLLIDSVPTTAGVCEACPEGMIPSSATTCQCEHPCFMESTQALNPPPPGLPDYPACIPGLIACGSQVYQGTNVAWFQNANLGTWYRQCLPASEDPAASGGMWCEDFDTQNPPSTPVPAPTANPCGPLEVMNNDTSQCECISGAELNSELVCQCAGNTATTLQFVIVAGSFSLVTCAPCPDNSVPTANHTSCACEEGFEFVQTPANPDGPTVAGECIMVEDPPCPSGMTRINGECYCINPCKREPPAYLMEQYSGDQVCFPAPASCGPNFAIMWAPLPPGTWSQSCVPNNADPSNINGMWCEDFDLQMLTPGTTAPTSMPTTAPPGGNGGNGDSQPTPAVTRPSRPTTSTPAPTKPSRPTTSTPAPTKPSRPTTSTPAPTKPSRPTTSTPAPTKPSRPTTSTPAPTKPSGPTTSKPRG